MKYLAIAFYRFTKLENPLFEIERYKKYFANKDFTGRIYISEEGVNAQLSGARTIAEEFMTWVRNDPRFSDQYFNIHNYHEQIFPRMTVKYREQIVALDEEADAANETGIHVPPSEWRRMLEEEENKIVIDVRNDYEWKIGHFEGSTLPPLEQFRDFPAYAEQLKQEIDPEKTKVMMYCTGGIRCEIYSALLKKKGFKEVYQLEGGIIRYGNEEGNAHWKGKLFVFDDRMAVPIDGKSSEIISQCSHCQTPSDTYYNCSNMDCNNLYLSCPECQHTLKGCCSAECSQSPRLRPYEREGNKPFKRKHLIGCCDLKKKS